MSMFKPPDELVEATLLKTLNAQMLEAAQPALDKAMAEVEEAMRKRLAEMVVNLVRTSYSAYRDGQDLMIRVNFDKAKP
jgi:hypothetical protein